MLLLVASAISSALNASQTQRGFVVAALVETEFRDPPSSVNVHALYREWCDKQVKYASLENSEKPAKHMYMRKLLLFLMRKLRHVTKWKLQLKDRMFLSDGISIKQPDWLLFPCLERYPSLSTLCVPGVITAQAQCSVSHAESMAEAVADAYRNSFVSMRQRLDYEWEDFNLDTFRAFGIATNAESIQFMLTQLKRTKCRDQLIVHRDRTGWLPLKGTTLSAQPTPGFIALVRLLGTPPETLYRAQPPILAVPCEIAQDNSLTLSERLGRGGSADVFVTTSVIDAGISEECAVKRVRDVTSVDEVSLKLRHEAVVLRELAGVSGVPSLLYEHIPETPSASNMPYLVLQPVGVPLANFMYDGIGISSNDTSAAVSTDILNATHKLAPKLLVKRANRVFKSLSKTLRKSSHKWTHIDLRPSNIVWANRRAYLVDWGNAQRTGERAETLGVQQYMSDLCVTTIYDPEEGYLGACEGDRMIEPKMDQDALAYYSAMLHGGPGLSAPWAIIDYDYSLLPMVGRKWYNDHLAKVVVVPFAYLDFLLVKLRHVTQWKMEWVEGILFSARNLRKQPDWVFYPCNERHPSASAPCVVAEIKARKRSRVGKSALMAEAVGDAYHYSLISMMHRMGLETIHLDVSTFRALGIATNCESIQFMFAELKRSESTLYGVCRQRNHTDWLPLMSATPESEPTAGFIALVRLLCAPPEELYHTQPLIAHVPSPTEWLGTNVIPGEVSQQITLSQRLGRGGSSDVYTATVNGGEVAVKRLRHSDNVKLIPFNHEAFVLSELSGTPGVPTLLGTRIPEAPHVLEDMPYLVLQPVGIPLPNYLFKGIITSVDGASSAAAGDILAATHKRAPSVVEKRARLVVNMISSTLRDVAKKGWAHIDLRPSNIVWTQGRAFLVDWGSARRINTKAEVLGVKLFMSDLGAESIMDPLGCLLGPGEGLRKIRPKMDQDALAYTYSAMLNGGPGLRAPWSAMEYNDFTMASARRDWYNDHLAKVPDCPCLVLARKLKLL